MAFAKIGHIFLLFSLISSVHGLKVLIFVPGFTDGQIKLFVRFGDLLTNAGHNVTLFRPQYNPDVRQHDPKSTGVKEIRYKTVDNAETYRQWMHETSESVYRDITANFWTIVSYALDGSQKFGLSGCEKQLADSKLISQLKNERFDVAVVEAEDLCSYGLVRVLEIPAYTCLTSGILDDYVAWASHIPSPVSYVPNPLSQFSDRMSLGQRVQNLAAHTVTPMVYRATTLESTNALFRKHFGKDFPNLETLIAQTPIIFVNDDELFDFPRPILHKVVYVGGFSTGGSRPLSGSWKKLMDDASNGVVLISFGNILKGSAMPLKWKAAIMNACLKFPTYTFILKFDEQLDTAGRNLTNLKLAPWIPQEALLAHPNMKAFVTEGGLNSIMESTRNGVPMVIVPLFGDQMGNRYRAQRHGMSVGIEKRKFKTRKLVEALEKVLHNQTYKQNAERLSRMIKSKPVKPDELAVGWLEFVAEYKSIPNFQPASLNLSFFEYFLVDAISIVLLIAAIFTYIMWRICFCYYWRCCETSFHEKQA